MSILYEFGLELASRGIKTPVRETWCVVPGGFLSSYFSEVQKGDTRLVGLNT